MIYREITYLVMSSKWQDQRFTPVWLLLFLSEDGGETGPSVDFWNLKVGEVPAFSGSSAVLQGF